MIGHENRIEEDDLEALEGKVTIDRILRIGTVLVLFPQDDDI